MSRASAPSLGKAKVLPSCLMTSLRTTSAPSRGGGPSWPVKKRTGLVSDWYILSQQIGHFFHLAFLSGNGLESSSECMNRIKQGRQNMWPHFAIRGATGWDKHI